MSKTKLSAPHAHSHALIPASLAALGVVYGDIGTSSLYALREAGKAAANGSAITAAAAIAATSAILWSLIVVVALKYALLILRADNKGEGGIMAMLALLHARAIKPGGAGRSLLLVGLVGAALLYGDGVITPAVSVLSAMEGLKTDAPQLHSLVLPLTIGVLIGLFLLQSRGTGRIGRIFGPIMLFWFLTIAALGLLGIARAPAILAALEPWSALEFFARAPFAVDAAVLGAAFLAVTGGEAMYADLGHFGATPIRVAWFMLVLPALILNYLGQGALLIASPAALDNPFYRLVPDALHYPMVALAAAATVIASQSILSGAFSLTAQAIQLGFLPRLALRHTDKQEFGQVYLPAVNALLAAGTLAAVLAFRTSDALAGAYGIAVSMLMVITTGLATLIARQWGYSWAVILPVNGLFLIVDACFFGANIVKLFEGGWFPLLIAGTVAFVMLTWRKGEQLAERERVALRPDEAAFVKDLALGRVNRSSGAAAFLSPAEHGIPLPLARIRKLTETVPEQVLLVSVLPVEDPTVPPETRTVVQELGAGVRRVAMRFGFAEGIDVPQALSEAARRGLLPGIGVDALTYYLGRESYYSRAGDGMAPWRERLFARLHLNVEHTASYFCVPPDRVIEVGTELAI